MGYSLLINTMGPNCMAVYQNGEKSFQRPTVSKEVFDVTGCGDSVCAILGIALAQGKSYEQAVEAANKAASYTIQHLGCYVLTEEEIKECLNGTES